MGTKMRRLVGPREQSMGLELKKWHDDCIILCIFTLIKNCGMLTFNILEKKKSFRDLKIRKYNLIEIDISTSLSFIRKNISIIKDDNFIP